MSGDTGLYCECTYWCWLGDGPRYEAPVGECRRHAPSPPPHGVGYGVWGRTKDVDWCGEFYPAVGEDEPVDTANE